MTDPDQEKIMMAGAAVGGSLVQFNYIREKLKVGKAVLVFITGLICGLYGGPYIASLIPGCSRELMFLIIGGTAFLGKSILGVVFHGVERRGPKVFDKGADFIEEKIGGHKDKQEDTEEIE